MPVSGPEVIYDNYAQTATFGVSSGSFTLNSFYIDGQNTTVTLTADLLGGGTESTSIPVTDAAATFVDLDWAGITGVTFTTPGGEYFSLDNVTVNATPEPSSLILLGTGALSLAGAARRKFRKA